MTDPSIAGIVVAAGTGTRLGASRPKAMVELSNRPLYKWAVTSLREGGCGRLVIVVPQDGDWPQRIKAAEPSAVVVGGGATRQQSVMCGLAALADDPPEIVLVHDAARALAPAAVTSRVIQTVRRGHRSVTPVLPIPDTVRQLIDGGGSQLLDRATLRTVQTPQGFDFATLLRAHQHAVDADIQATDDVTLCERLGVPAWPVEGSPMAFKITTPKDLTLAFTLENGDTVTENLFESRTGVGVDAHRLGDGVPMRLAGLDFPEEPRGLIGHSDGDVAAHAICDALLTAAGLGDVGTVFGVDNSWWSGASGVSLLTHAAELVRGAGWRIANATVTIVGNRPQIAPRRAEAEGVLTAAVGAPVTVAATTTDGMGFTGHGEGVAAMASALLQKP